MCWPMPYQTHEQVNRYALSDTSGISKLAYPEGFQSIQVDANANIALQPIIFQPDQFQTFQQHEAQSL